MKVNLPPCCPFAYSGVAPPPSQVLDSDADTLQNAYVWYAQSLYHCKMYENHEAGKPLIKRITPDDESYITAIFSFVYSGVAPPPSQVLDSDSDTLQNAYRRDLAVGMRKDLGGLRCLTLRYSLLLSVWVDPSAEHMFSILSICIISKCMRIMQRVTPHQKNNT